MINDKDLMEMVAMEMARKVLASPEAVDIVTKLVKGSWRLDDAEKDTVALKKALDEAVHEINLLRAEMDKRHKQASAILHLALGKLPGHRLNVYALDPYNATLSNAKTYRITIGDTDTFITFNPDVPCYPGVINFDGIPREAIVMTGDGHLLAFYDETIAAMHEKARAVKPSNVVPDHVRYQYDDKDGFTATGHGINQPTRKELAALIDETLKELTRLDNKDK